MPDQDPSLADDLQTVRGDLEKDLADARDHVDQGKAVPHPLVKRLLDWLPAVTGAAGGIAGGIGGTVGGFGVGGVPGAIGGAALGGAAGEALKQIGNAAVGNPAPTTYGETASSIGKQALMQGGAEAVGAAAGPILTKAGGALLQSALKPGVKATAQAFAKGVAPENLPLVQTMLNEGVNVSHGGIAKLNRLISATNDEIKDAVSTLPGVISPANVATRTDALAARYAKQVNPVADVNAVNAAKQEFLATQPNALSPVAAQELKSGTYRALGEKAYGELKAPAIEAQKALARGLKEDIQSEAAKSGIDLGAKNAREGAAIDLKEAIAKRLAAAGNKDPIALAWLAHNPVTGLAYVLEQSPAAKSLIGRGAINSASTVAKISPNVLRLLLSSIASSGSEDQPQ